MQDANSTARDRIPGPSRRRPGAVAPPPIRLPGLRQGPFMRTQAAVHTPGSGDGRFASRRSSAGARIG